MHNYQHVEICTLFAFKYEYVCIGDRPVASQSFMLLPPFQSYELLHSKYV